MIGFATCTVSIFSGTAVNAAGDEIDSNDTPAATGVPATFARLRKPIVYNEASYTPRTVGWYTVRLPRRTVVSKEDRLKNERTGNFYLVDTVELEEGVRPEPDLRVTVRKVN